MKLYRPLVTALLYGLIGPFIGAITVCITVSLIFAKRVDDTFYILMFSIFLAYCFYSIPAVLTGLVSSFIKVTGIRKYLIVSVVGAISSLLTVLLFLRHTIFNLPVDIALISLSSCIASMVMVWICQRLFGRDS